MKPLPRSLPRNALAPSLCALFLAMTGCGDESPTEPVLTPEGYSLVPLWRDQYDSGNGNVRGFDNPGYAIATEGVVVVSGAGGTVFGDPDGILRAFEGRTGRPLWSDTVDGSGCGAYSGEMVTIGERLFVGGAHCQDEGVRAFDLHSGRLLWATERADAGTPFSPLLVSNGLRVGSIDPEVTGLKIRMQDPSDGAVVWAADTDLSFYPHAVSSARVLVVAGVPGASQHLRFRAYDATSGEELWVADLARTSSFEQLDAMSIGNGVLVSATWPGTYGSRLHTRDELTGEILWAKTIAIGVRSIAVDAERIYVAGIIPDLYDKFSVAAYSRTNGELVWWDSRHGKRMSEHAEWAVLDGNRLVVGGLELQLRAYNAATGEVLEELFRGDEAGIGRALATDSGNIYSLAGVFEPDATEYANQDFLIRAFRENTH